MSEQPLPEEPECLCGRDPSGLRADIVCPVHDGDGSIERPMRERIDALARVIGPVLRRLYPQNPDLVLGREARHIAAALLESDAVLAVMPRDDAAPVAVMVNRTHAAYTEVVAERDALQARVAVQKAKVSMYEDWLREHVPDCPMLAENIVADEFFTQEGN